MHLFLIQLWSPVARQNWCHHDIFIVIKQEQRWLYKVSTRSEKIVIKGYLKCITDNITHICVISGKYRITKTNTEPCTMSWNIISKMFSLESSIGTIKYKGHIMGNPGLNEELGHFTWARTEWNWWFSKPSFRDI